MPKTVFLFLISLAALSTFTIFGCSDKTSSPNRVVKEEDGSLKFTDPNLEQCVKSSVVGRNEDFSEIFADANADGKISVEEAQKITDLSCSGAGIRSMEGIEILSNLEYVNCSGNEMGVMPDFTKLTKLKTLRCVNNFFTDADCPRLANLKNADLETLEIRKQRDGRILTCRDVEFLGRVKHLDAKPKKIFTDNTVNDVWGFVHKGHEYAVYGTTTDIHIVRVFDREPYFEKTVSIPRGEKDAQIWTDPNHSAWGEYRYFSKNGKAYLYASGEGNWQTRDTTKLPALVIVDITDIEKPKKIKMEDVHPGLHSIHNITIDESRELLIAFGGTDHFGEKDERDRFPAWKGARFYSIEDPEKPKYIRTVGKYYVHDGQIKTEQNAAGEVTASRLYLAHGSTAIHWDASNTTNEDNRFIIYDVKDVESVDASTPMPILVDHQYQYGYAHNIWVSDDNKYVVMTGETSMDNQLSFWEIVTDQQTGKMSAEFRNGINLQGGSLAHNSFIRGKHIYVSHYSKGVQIFEIFKDPATGYMHMRAKWAYDTFPKHNTGEMDGCWGVYPFAQNGKFFYASDESSGLYIFKKTDKFLAEEEAGIQ